MPLEKDTVVAGSSGGTGASDDGGGESVTLFGRRKPVPGTTATVSCEAVTTTRPLGFNPIYALALDALCAVGVHIITRAAPTLLAAFRTAVTKVCWTSLSCGTGCCRNTIEAFRVVDVMASEMSNPAPGPAAGRTAAT